MNVYTQRRRLTRGLFFEINDMYFKMTYLAKTNILLLIRSKILLYTELKFVIPLSACYNL